MKVRVSVSVGLLDTLHPSPLSFSVIPPLGLAESVIEPGGFRWPLLAL